MSSNASVSGAARGAVLVTVVECGVDELVQDVGGVDIASCITYRVEHGGRGLGPNPLLPSNEPERGIDSRNYRMFGCRRSSFRPGVVRADSHRTPTLINAKLCASQRRRRTMPSPPRNTDLNRCP